MNTKPKAFAEEKLAVATGDVLAEFSFIVAVDGIYHSMGGNMVIPASALTDAAKKHAGKAAPAAAAPAASSSGGGGGDGPAGFASTAIFETIGAGLKANPAAAKKVR